MKDLAQVLGVTGICHYFFIKVTLISVGVILNSYTNFKTCIVR